jgi:hypothetical protein
MYPVSSYRYELTGYLPPRFLLGWRWQVRAEVKGAWADWSEERTFDVAPPRTKLAAPRK